MLSLIVLSRGCGRTKRGHARLKDNGPNDEAMSTVLITGGAGFIGNCLVRQCLSEGAARVINLDKLTYASSLDSLANVNSDPRYTFVQGDIGDPVLVGRLLAKHRPQAVLHLAAETHVDRSIDSPAPFVETNVLGTCRLLQAVLEFWRTLPTAERQAFRFVHDSTDEVYGSLGSEGRFCESSPYAPNSPYAASKAASDHFVRAYHHTYGLPVLTINCSNNYGPWQFPEKLIPLMILNALEAKPLPVYGDGQNVRDWLYVDDHCRAIRLVLERGTPGESYNVGASCEVTNLELVKMICEIVDALRPCLTHRPCATLITFVQDRPGHDRRYAVDAGKLRRELGWQPRQDFAAGLRLTVEWYLQNAAWLQRAQMGAHFRERLGLGPLSSELPS